MPLIPLPETTPHWGGGREEARINDQVLWREICSISSRDLNYDLLIEQDSVTLIFPVRHYVSEMFTKMIYVTTAVSKGMAERGKDS